MSRRPVLISLALSLALASSGFCNSLKNNSFGVGGGGRNRPDFPAVATQICLILLAIQANRVLSKRIAFYPLGVRFGVRLTTAILLWNKCVSAVVRQ
jgi:hypothetical protein